MGCPSPEDLGAGEDEVGTEDEGESDGGGATTGEGALGLGLEYSPIKGFVFTWPAVSGTGSYLLYERQAPGLPFFIVAERAEDGSADYELELEVPLHLRASAGYMLRACEGEPDGPCEGSEIIDVDSDLSAAAGYFKAPNPDVDDGFGGALALSKDGSTLAVAAWSEDGGSPGLGGDPGDDSSAGAGAVYLYSRVEGEWVYEAYLKASNTGMGDGFGRSLALSKDGSTLAVGAPWEDGDEDSDESVGAAYVFERLNGEWFELAQLGATDADAGDEFGSSVALSSSGSRLIVGAPTVEPEGPDGRTIVGTEDSGAAYVFEREMLEWGPGVRLAASEIQGGAHFGEAVTISGDGNWVAAGAPFEGVGGGVQIYESVLLSWVPQAHLSLAVEDPIADFGSALAFDDDGSTLAVGAPRHALEGAVHVFARDDQSWSIEGVLGFGETGDEFGASVALSDSGSVLAVGAPGEDGAFASLARGSGEGLETGLVDSGAAHLFVRSIVDKIWSQRTYVKSPAASKSEGLGAAVGLSEEGFTLVVGAPREAGSASGVGGEVDAETPGAGAVWMY